MISALFFLEKISSQELHSFVSSLLDLDNGNDHKLGYQDFIFEFKHRREFPQKPATQ